MKDILTIDETKQLVTKELEHITEREYAEEIAENIAQEVMEDIQESADINFNDSDVRLAIGRVLVNLTSIGK